MANLENNEKLLEIGKKVYAMTKEQMETRLKVISAHIKDCSDLGVLVDNNIQLEAMSITTRIMMDNDTLGCQDGDYCDDETCHCDGSGHCEC